MLFTRFPAADGCCIPRDAPASSHFALRAERHHVLARKAAARSSLGTFFSGLGGGPFYGTGYYGGGGLGIVIIILIVLLLMGRI